MATGTSRNVRPGISAIKYEIEVGTRGEMYEIVVRPGEPNFVASIELPAMEFEGDELDAFVEIVNKIKLWHCMPEAKG
jgi:hypothetical protein